MSHRGYAPPVRQVRACRSIPAAAPEREIYILHKEEKILVKEPDIVQHQAPVKCCPGTGPRIFLQVYHTGRDPARPMPRSHAAPLRERQIAVEFILPSGKTIFVPHIPTPRVVLHRFDDLLNQVRVGDRVVVQRENKLTLAARIPGICPSGKPEIFPGFDKNHGRIPFPDIIRAPVR